MDQQSLFNTLENQLNKLRQDIDAAPIKEIHQPRFDHQLFRQKDSRLPHYLTEIEKNFLQLKQSVVQNHQQQVAFLAERIVAQISALHRELATQTLRKIEKSSTESDGRDIYQKLAQHQDYERRLEAMLRDREVQLGQQALLSEQQKIQKELATLEGRLLRCRQALKKIEKQIEQRENGHY